MAGRNPASDLVLVTGATGFVGQWLLEELLENGAAVAGTGLPAADGSSPRLSRHVREGEARYRCQAGVWHFSPLDVTDGAAVARALAALRPATVYHLAAQSSAGLSFQDPHGTFAVNVGGTLNLLEAIRALPAAARPRLLVVGSADEYGAPEQPLPLTERAPLRPLSPYGSSKAAATLLCRQYHAAHGLPVIVARPFSHTGPGQSVNFAFPSWARQLATAARTGGVAEILVGDLRPHRDYLHVRDVVRAYRLLAERGLPGQVYNVASGAGTTLQNALDILCRASELGVRVRTDPDRLRPADIPHLVGDAAKLRAATGWVPKLDLETALRDLLQWMREQP